jgi:hypothetical protein
MKEIKGNVFDFIEDPDTDSICITTNGIVGATGLATMGAGTAGEAARRWLGVRKNLGNGLKVVGNVPFVIGIINKEGMFINPKKENFQDILDKNYKCLIWSFPTKDDFRNNSILPLIQKSAVYLSQNADKLGLKKIVIPRPGCSNGKLSWADVKPAIEPLLDDRFVIVSLEDV